MPTSATETFDIAELARQAGVSARTIRYYEELGLVRASSRGPGGRRLYDADAAERLRFIARLKTLGLTLDEIGALNGAFEVGSTPAMLAELEGVLDEHIASLDERIEDLRALDRQLRDYRERIRSRKKRNGPCP
jgi:DNA-binding transcriptional MerR regulator